MRTVNKLYKNPEMVTVSQGHQRLAESHRSRNQMSKGVTEQESGMKFLAFSSSKGQMV